MKKEEKKKFWSKQNIVAMSIAFIMITSAIGYMWGKDIENVKYKEYSFSRGAGEWTLKFNKAKISFNYLPSEVEDINVSTEIITKLKGLIEIDTTSDENDSYSEIIAQAQYSMAQNLGLVSNTYLRLGMTSENQFNLPVITCKDATAAIPVLYFKKSNITEIDIKDNCITAKAKSEIDILRIKDRLLYGILGII